MPQPTSETGVRAIEGISTTPQNPTITLAPGMTMADIERAAIEASLKHTRGNRRKAAEMLGIGERTMYRKLREYEIPIDSIELE
jgi:DNA-binding NtrC family response regulator